MVARHQKLSALSIVSGAIVTAAIVMPAIGLAEPTAADTPAAGTQGAMPGAQAGHWQAHTYDFHVMGFTSTYSCDGLEGKLKLLLRLARAREDAKVDALCPRGYGVPDKLAQAKVTFSTLQIGSPSPEAAASASPAASAAATSGPAGVAGVWRHVEIAPHRPFELQLGDCELVEQFRDRMLPMFTTRNLKSQVTCVPHQESGSNFSLRFDVFAPVPAAKSP
jgi:hypothetical protein